MRDPQAYLTPLQTGVYRRVTAASELLVEQLAELERIRQDPRGGATTVTAAAVQAALLAPTRRRVAARVAARAPERCVCCGERRRDGEPLIVHVPHCRFDLATWSA